MPRLFTGIEVPEDIASQLSMLRGKLPGARWVDPANYHITLRFAGDIDETQADDFAEALADIEAESFDAELDGLGSFGGRKPRSIWAGLKPCEPLIRLQKAHERAARRAGLEPETQNFTPHITLARLKNTSPIDVADYLSHFGRVFALPFRVTRFVLFSARAFQGGGPYVVEEAYSLAASGAEEK